MGNKRNQCEIAKSPYYQNLPCSIDFAKLRNCEIVKVAKSAQYVVRICNVQM